MAATATAIEVNWEIYGLQDAAEWAERRGVSDEFCLLLDMCGLSNFPAALGTVLHALSDSRSRLELWAAEGERGAEPLRKLADALAADTDFLASRQPFRDLKPARRRFQGYLSQLFLPAVFAEEALQPSQTEVDWWRCFSMWLLTHAVDRAMSGNLEDGNIKAACIAAYNASDTMQPWRHAMIHSFATHLSRFTSLNRHIENKASELLSNHAELKSRSLKRDLEAILAVSRFEHGASTSSVSASVFSGMRQLNVSLPPSLAFDWDIEDDNHEDGIDVGVVHSRAKRLDQDTFEIDVGASDSETENDHTGESILLFTAEQKQFLPWQWTRLNAKELAALTDWIDRSLEAGDSATRLLAVIVRLSLETGRTPEQVSKFNFSGQTVIDWSVDLTGGCLRRIPPRRESAWEPRSVSQIGWVRPVADAVTIMISTKVLNILTMLTSQYPLATTLAMLWQSVANESMRKVLSATLQEIHPRLRPGMLASTQLQRWYEDKGDDAFARLMASSPNSGLPAACAYASWIQEEINQGQGIRIAAGSRLDPIESMLVQAIATARDRVMALRGGHVFSFHNAYTAYRVMQIYAAGAGRPVSDPYESAKHFDFKDAWLYIDDKASGDLRQGRVIPLPRKLANELEQDYLNHLGMLAETLADSSPALASEIAVLASGQASSHLPFFFFLDQTSERGWVSVTGNRIETLDLFAWPLPINLFRHRLSQKLRRLALNTEIIAGIMGHAEAYAASYGDYSLRIWQDDMATARPVLELAYEALQFGPLSTWDSRPEPVQTSMNGPLMARPFGIAARESARRKTRLAAFRTASESIRRTLAGRQLDELSEDEMYSLATKLLLNEKGMPTPHGYLRYSLLIHRIERHQHGKGKRTRLTKRFFRFQEEASPFGPEAIGAIKRLEIVENMLDDKAILAAHAQDGRPNCAFAAAVMLAVRNRIADRRILRDVSLMQHVRLVSVTGTPLLEHGSFNDIDDPDVPVRRIPLPLTTARLLNQAAGNSLGERHVKKPPPKFWDQLIAVLFRHGEPAAVNRHNVLDMLARLVDQVNALTLPGIQAGVLAGRIATFAPGWSDLIMLRTGKRIVFEEQKEEATGDEPRSHSLLLSHTATPKTAFIQHGDVSDGNATHPHKDIPADEKQLCRSTRRQAAMLLFKEIRSCLRGVNPEEKKQPVDKKVSRRDIAIWLRRTLVRHMHAASSACILLGEWLLCLVAEGARKDLDLSSIKRYASALTPVFESEAFDTDLLGMDEDEITELYTRLLTSRRLRKTRFPYARLTTFHRWAQKSDYGLPEIDWSELPDVPDRESVLPGIITEQEYLEALKQIATLQNEARQDLVLGASFMLICAYRFGLRRRESWGMARCDWVDHETRTIVLARSNRHRKLKTRGSRRQVPQLFSFLPIEQNIINACLARFESLHGDRHTTAILAGSDGLLTPVEYHSTIVNSALKITTGNAIISLHHARHTFANKVLLAATGRIPAWDRLTGNRTGPSFDIMQTLLGRTDCRRRIAWAVGRVLGHMGAQTTFRSYIHLMDDWIAVTLGTKHIPIKQDALPRFIDLDRFAIYARPAEPLALPGINRRQRMDYSSALQVLRLLSRGRDAEDIALELALNPQEVNTLTETVTQIGNRLTLQRTRIDDRSQKSPFDFLRRISHYAWRRLNKHQPADTRLQCSEHPLIVLGQMVGRTRQLLIWSEDTAAYARWLIDSLIFPPDRYYLVITNSSESGLPNLIRKYRFDAVPLKEHLDRLKTDFHTKAQVGKAVICDKTDSLGTSKTTHSFQIDTISIPVGGVLVSPVSRCALVIRERGSENIRNSIEFLAAALALSTSFSQTRVGT